MELLSREGELQSKMNEEEGKYVPGHLDKLPKPSVKPPRDWGMCYINHPETGVGHLQTHICYIGVTVDEPNTIGHTNTRSTSDYVDRQFSHK